ncbi:MAG: peptidoglycan-N-acetylglucosamine deacetylase [Trichococcus sp.]|nr:peptidoglycan-N-acetylglucosamine deacetylase [Trichococcus sp.]
MHTGYGANGTTAALPNIINQLRAMGYSFVTLSQLMNTTSTPGTGTGTSYTVKAGDTLYAIALRYGVTVQTIINANGITNGQSDQYRSSIDDTWHRNADDSNYAYNRHVLYGQSRRHFICNCASLRCNHHPAR